MYNGQKVIDVHGHMSTPPQFRAYAYNLIALRSRAAGRLEIPEDQMEQALARHFRMLDTCNIDVQMISPRPVAMMHWESPILVQQWTRTTNDIIHEQCVKHGDRFVGIAQLPQNRDADTSNCLTEFERCVNELGFVGALVNPDPGADRQTPAVHTSYWYPLYEKAQELRAPLIIHPSISRDPRIEILQESFQYNNLTEETLATLLYEQSDVFERFPELRIVICHCGGALRRLLPPERRSGERGGGQVGITVAEEHNRHRVDASENLFFDTCAYDPDFLTTAIKQRGPKQMLFGSEVPGSGTSTLNPYTNRPSDDLVPVIDQMESLTDSEKMGILTENAKHVFPLLKVA